MSFFILRSTKYPTCPQEASQNDLTLQPVIDLILLLDLLQINTNLLRFVHVGTFVIAYLIQRTMLTIIKKGSIKGSCGTLPFPNAYQYERER